MCYQCKQPGHHIRDCPNRPKPQQNHQQHSTTTPLEQQQQQIKRLLITLAEQSANTTERNLHTLAQQLAREVRGGEGTVGRDFVLTTLMHAVKALPAKHNVFAVLVGLLTVAVPSFASDVVQLTNVALTHAAAAAQHDELRLLLRWLVALSHARVVSVDDTYAAIGEVMGWVQQAMSAAYRDFYLYALVSLLPWLGVEHHNLPNFHNLLAALSSLMSVRPPPSPLVRCLQSDESEDLLLSYWRVVKAVVAQQGEGGVAWRTELILRPHIKLASDLAALSPLPLALTLATPPNSPAPPSLPPLLNLFPDHPLPPTLSSTTLAHYVLLTQLLDILGIYTAIHKEATRQLLLLPTGEDYSAVLVSLLFSSLFTLPSTSTSLLYIAAIIIDLFKAEPTLLPPIIGLAINALFERLDALDMETFDRLLILFSFHLSNFSYAWPWDNWSAVLETDEYTPQRIFVSEMYERMVRLSFWERIQQTVPEELVALMPHQPLPAFRFASAGEEKDTKMGTEEESKGEAEAVVAGGESELNRVAAAVLRKIGEKVSSEELIAYLDSVLSTSSSLSSPAQLLFPCILHAGHKSYSHLFALFDRYGALITHYGTAHPQHLVDAISEYWQHSQQHQLVILDRLLARQWLQPAVLLTWSLQASKVELMHRGFVWELVAVAMERLSEKSEDEKAECVRVLLAGVNRALRVGGKNEGLIVYVENRVRGVVRRWRGVLLSAPTVLKEMEGQLDVRLATAIQQAATL